MRILLVEDDAQLSTLLAEVLRDSGFVVDMAADGAEGRYLGESGDYDAVVLDLGLPGVDGLTVLRGWRDGGLSMPVLILTARGRWPEKLDGFNAGADDYLTKPFEMEEVVVRLRALIRRSAGHATVELKCGPVSLDTNTGRFAVDGVPLQLTAQEARILEYFMHHPEKVVSRTELMEHIYDRTFDPDSNVVDVLIGRIRQKLSVGFIHTVRGKGYRVEVPHP